MRPCSPGSCGSFSARSLGNDLVQGLCLPSLLRSLPQTSLHVVDAWKDHAPSQKTLTLVEGPMPDSALPFGKCALPISRTSLPFPGPGASRYVSPPWDFKWEDEYSILEEIFIPGQILFFMSSGSLGNSHPRCYSLTLYWSPGAGSHSRICLSEVKLEQGAM